MKEKIIPLYKWFYYICFIARMVGDLFTAGFRNTFFECCIGNAILDECNMYECYILCYFIKIKRHKEQAFETTTLHKFGHQIDKEYQISEVFLKRSKWLERRGVF